MLRRVEILVIFVFVLVYLDIRIFDLPVILVLPQDQWEQLLSRANQLIFQIAIWTFTFLIIVDIKHVKDVILTRATEFVIPSRLQVLLGFILVSAIILLTLFFTLQLEHIVLDRVFAAD